MIRSYKDILAYKNSKKLYPIVVKVTATYPPAGRSLADQTCRAANGIHSDIAEGYGRSVAEFKHYLTRALGSNNECLSHLEDAKAVGYLKPETADTLIAKYTIVGKQIYRLRGIWQ